MARDERSLVEILDDHHSWIADTDAGTRANLVGLDLRDMDFQGTDLRNADMRGSNLSGADFAVTDLRGANLSETVLLNADFRSAFLCYVDFLIQICAAQISAKLI